MGSVAGSPDAPIRRVAVLSMHTSPLHQPGGGNAGGMNVYIAQTARRLADRGVEVDVFTRAASRRDAVATSPAPGVTVHHVTAGPYGELSRAELADQLCPFTFGVLRAGAGHERAHYDLVHAHYWLSGQAGRLVAHRWGVPFVHTMHTMGKVKNAARSPGEPAEPAERIAGETQVVAAADRLVANTGREAGELVGLYGASPARVSTVSPGVDAAVFAPGDRLAARARLGLPADAVLLLFVGRVQPHKGPDVLVAAAAGLLRRRPELTDRLRVAVVGGASGGGSLDDLRDRAAELGIADAVRLVPPCPQTVLADWYRAATVTVVPSRSESFGLAAAESLACGAPVVAADVGGLSEVVTDGVTGALIDGHRPAAYAAAIDALTRDPGRYRAMRVAAARSAARFSWDATTDGLLEAYGRAREADVAMARVAGGAPNAS